MKRADLIARLRTAGYHDDQAAFVRLYVEHRVRIDVARRAYAEGEKLRAAGIRCDCFECRRRAAG